jgi:hypothetical protein
MIMFVQEVGGGVDGDEDVDLDDINAQEFLFPPEEPRIVPPQKKAGRHAFAPLPLLNPLYAGCPHTLHDAISFLLEVQSKFKVRCSQTH